MLQEIRCHKVASQSFAFEITLSGKAELNRAKAQIEEMILRA
jgi:hypothetical protein